MCIYNNDGSVQAAYGHKQIDLFDNITVDLTGASIGFSLVGKMEKYYGEPVAIYDYK